MAIKQCAVLGFFVSNLFRNRHLGRFPPPSGRIADIKPAPSCPDAAAKARYAAFLSDSNAARRNSLRLYLSILSSVTFQKTLKPKAAATGKRWFKTADHS